MGKDRKYVIGREKKEKERETRYQRISVIISCDSEHSRKALLFSPEKFCVSFKFFEIFFFFNVSVKTAR